MRHLVHQDQAGSAGERRVALEVLLVLRPRGRSDRAQLASRDSFGFLVVKSTIASSSVSIDGKSIGLVPAEAALSAGTHPVVVSHEGYDDAATQVVLKAGERKELLLDPVKGTPVTGKWWFWTIIGVVAIGGATAATVIALGTAVNDATYLKALQDALPPVVAQVRPGLVLYVAGADPATDDMVGDWNITAEGMLARDRFVVELLRPSGAPIPLAVVLGGGYGGNAWRYTARFLGWLASGKVVEPPSNTDMLLRRAEELHRILHDGARRLPPALTSIPTVPPAAVPR